MTTKTAPSKTSELIEKLVERIVSVIEAGETGEWTKPWTSVLAGTRFPVNAKTEATYQGINTLIGMVEAIDNDYGTNIWATYKQWASLEAQVRKGERGTQMVRWLESFSCAECGSWGPKPCEAKHVNSRRLSGRVFYVFNADQVDGYTVEVPVDAPDPHVATDLMVEASGAVIVSKISNEAFYVPATDVITLPESFQFDTTAQYYGTLLHELTHWTGHTSRLDRVMSGAFGSDAYASEELVAELGAVFMASHFQLEVDPHPEHVAYLASWLGRVKENPNILYEAAKDAQAAFSYLVKEEGHDNH